MINIKLPDGTTAQFPDNTSDATITSVLRKQFPSPSQPNDMQQAGAALTADQRTAAKKGYDYALQGLKQTVYPNVEQAKFDKVASEDLAPLNPQQITQNDQLLGFGGELSGAANAVADAFRGVPMNKSYEAWQKLQDARRDLGVEQSGAMGQGASILGQLTSMGAAAPAGPVTAAVSRVPQIAKDVAASGTTGAVLGGVQGFGSTDGDVGQRLRGAQQGAIAGGIVGTAAPIVLRPIAGAVAKMADNKAVNAALKNAPNAEDLSSAASNLFKTSKSAGIGVKPQKFGQFAHDVAAEARAADIDPDLDKQAWTVYDRMVGLAKDGFNDPSALSLSRIHNLRQKAQDVVMEQGAKNRTKQFAQNVVDGLDTMIENLKPSELTGPPNLLGSGKGAANALLEGIGTWSRAKKVGLIEEAMFKAKNQASGLENGLRINFRSIIQNPKTRKLFNPTELDALSRVANGTPISNVARLLGSFGFDAGSGRNALGGIIGAGIGAGLGGPAGAVVAGAGGMLARKASQAMANSAAQRAAKLIATPNIQIPRRGAVHIPSTLLPLLSTGGAG